MRDVRTEAPRPERPETEERTDVRQEETGSRVGIMKRIATEPATMTETAVREEAWRAK